MAGSVTIAIPEIPPSLNAWYRMHWAPRGAEKARWREMVTILCRRHRVFNVPVIVTVTYFFKTRKARDFDNYTPKLILDGLKGVLIPDDSSQWITELRIRFAYDKELPRTEVTLTPMTTPVCTCSRDQLLERGFPPSTPHAPECPAADAGDVTRTSSTGSKGTGVATTPDG